MWLNMKTKENFYYVTIIAMYMIEFHTLNETSTCQRDFAVCGTSQISPWDGSWTLHLTGTSASAQNNVTQER